MTDPRHMRIFLSSPGDVADERALALQVIEQLPYDPLLRSKVTFEVVAWDKPGAGTPMLATVTPQEAINQGLPRPSECDIVVVIFWARMGTPLDYKGESYLSGTHYEYEDAMQSARRSGRPEVVIYRRMEEIALKPTDPDFLKKYEQWWLVEDFFAGFVEKDSGKILVGYNTHTTPEDFRRAFETHLKALVKRLLEAPPADTPPAIALWPGSPFPGLRAFTPADAPIFFGRGRETDALVRRVSASRFVAVVGASGSLWRAGYGRQSVGVVSQRVRSTGAHADRR